MACWYFHRHNKINLEAQNESVFLLDMLKERRSVKPREVKYFISIFSESRMTMTSSRERQAESSS